MSRNPKVIIVGRPNVGKSALFNRLVGSHQSVVHDFPGVTRDLLMGVAEGITYVDSGGLYGDVFSDEIKVQIEGALDTANLGLFVVDGREGVHPNDRQILQELRAQNRLKQFPWIVVVNKCDARELERLKLPFYKLGVEPVMAVSASHGMGIEALENEIRSRLQVDSESTEAPKEVEKKLPSIAIVGRPNVGKSTLLNAWTGSKRSIVSPIAGTTVDPVDSIVRLDGKEFKLIDTAGVRKKAKTKQGVEVLSVVMVKKTLDKCDIALLVIDGETGPADQDEKIAQLIEEAGCAVVILVNKWDTQKNNQRFTQKVAAEKIRRQFGFLAYAPILFVSGQKKQGFRGLGNLFAEILEQRSVRIQTRELIEWIRDQSEVHNPKRAKFYVCEQVSNHPPTLVCRVNDPSKVHFTLERHLINAFRDRWGFMGSPIRMIFRKSESRPKP